ncbi:phosphatidylserine decarboxylase [Siculibacillus lacustris]|uniref:Phosphatidylserine decarboxylase proenzyme n=1 Tax=Siculibacillus lacustris TaxID=1549641 RepID=A0A4Q9VY37_9HYPH|nr:phosphatidylserine decarboxylase [Siculibacillus lacustris]TBW40882.1 phosphatidylserine decarboxylase [Siculibacillus lacustris]
MDSLFATITRAFPPINRAGWPFVAIALILTVVIGQFWQPLFWLLLGLTIWVAAFFRDPARVTPIAEGLVIAPADGRVSHIGPVLPPPELGLPAEEMLRISIFMNVFNVHVNRMPITGTVERIVYTPGKFLNAELDKASEFNERNALVVRHALGTLACVQIAGLVARRIVVWTTEGAELAAGERFGMIRFGSRLDVYLPLGTTPLVALGQTSIAGETILADLAAAPSAVRITRRD